MGLTKKIIGMIVIIVFLGLSFNIPIGASGEDNKIRVSLNGNILEFDQQPINYEGRVLVPLRVIFESMGAEVEWIGETKEVIGTKDNLLIKLRVESDIAYVNDNIVSLDVPAKIFNGRTLVPVRFIAESLGADVSWDGFQKMVGISYILNVDGIDGIVDINSNSNIHIEEIYKSDEEQVIAYNVNEFGVLIPSGTLERDSQISIEPVDIYGNNEEEFVKMNCYDIKISNHSRFDNDITLIFPIDYSVIDMGYDFELQFIAGYFDEQKKTWEPLPFEVDTDYGVVKVFTNHFTPIMVGAIKDKKYIDKLQLVGPIDTGMAKKFFEQAKKSVYGIKRYVNDEITLSKAKIEGVILATNAAVEVYWPEKTISAYCTKNFRLLYDCQQEKEVTENGYWYVKRQYKDSDYEKIEYSKNYIEFKGDKTLTEKEALERHKTLSLDEVVPPRIRETAMFLEESYANYTKDFKPVEVPYYIYIEKGGYPYDNKLFDTMYLPIESLSEPIEVKRIVSHELFHAIQRRYANLLDMSRNTWLMESTAEYAAHNIAYKPYLPYNGERNLNMNFFRLPLGTTEPFFADYKEPEYKSAKFIGYLVNNHNLSIKELFEKYEKQSLVHNFVILDEILREKDSSFMLGKTYLDFAGKTMFDTNSDMSGVNMYEEAKYKYTFTGDKIYHLIELSNSQAYLPQLEAIKVELPKNVVKTVSIQETILEGGIGSNIYLLKNNAKITGISPILEVYQGSKDKVSLKVENGDIIYVLTGNSKLGDPKCSDSVMKASFSLSPVSGEMKSKVLESTRTTKKVSFWVEGSVIDDLKDTIDFKWTVQKKDGGFLDLKNKEVAQILDESLTVTLIHENPIESWGEKIASGWVDPNTSSDNPFAEDLIIQNIDDGTGYIIKVNLIDKVTKKDIASFEIYDNVGMKTSLINCDDVSGGTINID